MKDEWPEWVKKLVQLAKLEATSRPVIRRLLKDLEDITEPVDNEDGMDIYSYYTIPSMASKGVRCGNIS